MNIYIYISHARPILVQLHHATRPILVHLHHATRSSLKVSEFRNYQRSLFSAKNFHARLVLFFSIDLVIRVVRGIIVCRPARPCIENKLVIHLALREKGEKEHQ